MFTNVLTLTALAISLMTNQPQVQQQESWVIQSLEKGQAKIIAHRGGALEAFENSLSAFQQVSQIKVWGVQMAVRSTQDNQLITFNDSTIERVLQPNEEQNSQWSVSQFNYADLPAYKDSIQNELGEWYHQTNTEQEKPPRFEDVLQVFQQTTQVLIIEDKLENWGEKFKMFKKVQEAGLWNRVIFQSDVSQEEIENAFGMPTLVVQKDQEIEQSYQNYLNGSWQQDRQAHPIQGDVFKAPWAFQTIQEAQQAFQQAVIFPQSQTQETDVTVQQLWQWLEQKEAEVQVMNSSLKQSGKPVIYWTANQEQDFQKAIELGVNAFITDRPAEAKVYMMSQQWAAEKVQSAQWQRR